MARFGVNTLKRFSFRGGIQHHGNTYYYESPGVAQPSLTTLEALLDFIVAEEKQRFSNQSTYVRGRVWSQLGTPAQNQMLVDKNLSGTGSATSPGNVDRERAWLVRFRAGVDSKGRPVYLRKYWHLDASLAGAAPTGAQLQNTDELTAAQKTAIETFGNAIKQITVGSPAVVFDLVSKGGRAIDGPTQAHRFIEHHQLGDEWRGA